MSAPGPAPSPTGAIHDLGYKRYFGTRRPQSTRWRVIVRNQMSSAWKTWWRFKLPLGWSLATMLTFTTIMFIASQYEETLAHVLSRFGILGNPYDTITTLAVPWLCRAAFLAGLTVGAGTIAADAQVGAFTFYFARPVRPIDYMLGKLGGLFLLNSFLITAPLFALTCVRVGLSPSTHALVAALPRLGSALATGTCGALLFAALPLAVSSLVGKRGYAIATWAVWYILIGGIFQGLAFATKTPALGAFDPLSAIDAIGNHLYDAQFLPRLESHVVPFGWALGLTLAISAAAIAVAHWQVSSRAVRGVGGS